MTERKMKMRVLERSFPTAFERTAPAADGAPATYRFAVSSEVPVERHDWWTGEPYIEVLSHAPGAANFERAKGGSIRDTHWGAQVGSSLGGDLGEDRRGYVEGVRFLGGARAQEIEAGINTVPPILQNVSIRYIPREVQITPAAKGGIEQRLITKWDYIHTAFEPDPADAGVGPGRAREDEVVEVPVRVLEPEPSREKERQMPEKPKETTEPGSERAVATLAPPEPKKADRKAEVDEILESAARNAIPTETVRDWLQRELTPDQVSTEILAHLRTQAVKQPASEALVKLSREAASHFSYRRAIAMAGGLIRADGLEKELSDELARRYPQARSKGGFLVPTRLIENERAFDAHTAGKGAELVQEGPLEFIDLLRNEIVFTRLGARLLPGLAAPVPFVRRTQGATVQWLGEGKTITRSDGKFTIVMLSGKRMGGAVQYSRELLLTASIDVEDLVKQDLVAGHAVAFDYAGGEGKGGAEPLGLRNISTKQTLAMGGVPSWSKITSMPGKTATKNALRGKLGFVTTPEMAAILQATPKIAGGSAGFLWEGPLQLGQMAGYPAASTNQLPTNLGTGADEHALWFGPWQEMVFGAFGALELIVDPFTGKLEGMVEVATHQLGDLVITMPEAFVLGTGAKLA